MLLENIKNLPKIERRRLMQIAKHKLPSQMEIAVQCDCSQALVAQVLSGLSTNETVINYIIQNTPADIWRKKEVAK